MFYQSRILIISNKVINFCPINIYENLKKNNFSDTNSNATRTEAKINQQNM